MCGFAEEQHALSSRVGRRFSAAVQIFLPRFVVQSIAVIVCPCFS